MPPIVKHSAHKWGRNHTGRDVVYCGLTKTVFASSLLRANIEPCIRYAVGSPEQLRKSAVTKEPGARPMSIRRRLMGPLVVSEYTTAGTPLSSPFSGYPGGVSLLLF